MPYYHSKYKHPKWHKFSVAFSKGFHEQQNKTWKCCQFQALAPIYKKTEDIKVREFGNYYEAVKFAEEHKKMGYVHQKINFELAEFMGAVCYKPQGVYVLYYSKKPLKLEYNPKIWSKSGNYSPVPVCTPKGHFPHDLSTHKRFYGAL